MQYDLHPKLQESAMQRDVIERAIPGTEVLTSQVWLPRDYGHSNDRSTRSWGSRDQRIVGATGHPPVGGRRRDARAPGIRQVAGEGMKRASIVAEDPAIAKPTAALPEKKPTAALPEKE